VLIGLTTLWLIRNFSLNANISITTKGPKIADNDQSTVNYKLTSTEFSTTQLTQPSFNDMEIAHKIVKVKEIYEPGFSQPTPHHLCPMDGNSVKLLIVVLSAPGHFYSRKAIRLTWGHYNQRSDVTIAFLVGKTDDEGVNKKIKSEVNLYGDVLLANFQDSYQNLTLKTMAMLEWTRYYCSKADYVLKADDDMFINVENLLKFIRKIEEEDRKVPKFYGRLVEGWKPVRDPRSPYFLPYEQFSDNVFPNFVTGPSYLFSTLIAQSLFNRGMESGFLQLEDVFLTGVIAMNVSRVRVEEFENASIDVEKTSRCELSKYISIHSIKYHEQFVIWRRILDSKTDC
jgi:hypothetical protein